MSQGKNGLSALETRKRLLLAESEMNRAQLLSDWQCLANDLHVVATQTSAAGSVASKAAVAFAGFKTLRGLWNARSASKLTVIGRVIKVASVATSLWMAFRASREPSEAKPRKK